jgi:hypothetical protein
VACGRRVHGGTWLWNPPPETVEDCLKLRLVEQPVAVLVAYRKALCQLFFVDGMKALGDRGRIQDALVHLPHAR